MNLFDQFLATQGAMKQNAAQDISNQFNLAKLTQMKQEQEAQEKSRQLGMQIAQGNLDKQANPAPNSVTLANLSEVPDASAESQGLRSYEVASPATAKTPKQSEILAQQADELKQAALKYGAIGDLKQQAALTKESDSVREKLYLNQAEERKADIEKQNRAAGAMKAINSQPALDDLWSGADADHRKAFAPYFNLGLDGKPIYDDKARQSLDFFGNKAMSAKEQGELELKALQRQIEQQKADNQRLRDEESARHNKEVEASQREGNKIKAQTTAAKPDLSTTMSDEAKDAAAARYNIDGTLPPNMGRGTQGAVLTAEILSRAAKIAKDSGDTPEATRIGQLANKASAQALGQLTKQEQAVGAFEKNALRNADIALATSAKADRTGSPVLNRWLLAGQKEIAGDVEVAKFNQATNTFVNEYAKIMSGSMGNTVVSDSMRKEQLDVLATKNTPEQFEAVVNQMKLEMRNRMKGFADQKAELTGSMKGSKASAPSFVEGQVYEDASGNKAKYVKGQWVPQ